METPEVSLLDYLKILKKRKRTILFIFVVSILLAGFLSVFVIPPTFEATTTLIFPQVPNVPMVFPSDQGQAQGVIGQVAGLAGLGGGQQPTDPYVAILKSQTITERAVTKFGLQQRYGTDTFQEAVKKLQDDVDTTTTKEGLIQLSVAMTDPSPLVLRLAPRGSTQNGNEDASHLAADIANFYIEALGEFTQNEIFLSTETRYRVYLEGQLEKKRADLQASEDMLRDFKEKSKVVSFSDEVKAALNNIANLEAAKIIDDAHLQEVEAQVNLTSKQIVEQTKAPLESLPSDSPFIKDLRNKLISQQADLTLATQQYGPSHPNVVKLSMELEQTKKQLDDEISRVLSSVKSKLAPELITLEQDRIGTSAKSAAEGRVLAQLKAQAGSVPTKETELSRLDRDVQILSEVYTLLSQETEKAKMAEARDVVTYQVLDRALPPDKKSRPRAGLNMAMAGILSLFLGISWAFLADYLGRARGSERPKTGSAAEP